MEVLKQVKFDLVSFDSSLYMYTRIHIYSFMYKLNNGVIRGSSYLSQLPRFSLLYEDCFFIFPRHKSAHFLYFLVISSPRIYAFLTSDKSFPLSLSLCYPLEEQIFIQVFLSHRVTRTNSPRFMWLPRSTCFVTFPDLTIHSNWVVNNFIPFNLSSRVLCSSNAALAHDALPQHQNGWARCRYRHHKGNCGGSPIGKQQGDAEIILRRNHSGS